jgi:hypothetical protein
MTTDDEALALRVTVIAGIRGRLEKVRCRDGTSTTASGASRDQSFPGGCTSLAISAANSRNSSLCRT